MSAVEDFDIDDTDEWVTVENDETSIVDQDIVERMVRHLGHLEREIVEAKAHRDAAVRQYTAEADEWMDRKVRRLNNTAEHIRYRISSWYLEQLASNPRAPKTLELISGVLKKKRPSEVVVVEDEKAFLVWDATPRRSMWSVWDRPRFTRQPAPRPVAPAPDKDAVKQAVKDGVLVEKDGVLVDVETSEIVPGVVLERHDHEVDIRPKVIR